MQCNGHTDIQLRTSDVERASVERRGLCQARECVLRRRVRRAERSGACHRHRAIVNDPPYVQQSKSGHAMFMLKIQIMQNVGNGIH